eukprot:TRINITY_DN192773_c0_g1_i1.p1 TRINITY_DN192773_c0_g1~~TRINITY_DN192773_c0_g1_i1.p1  ORF type:complete len:151 (-),score=6.12 TRINITY_DN192773_c0_g1_i1:18-470(-)
MYVYCCMVTTLRTQRNTPSSVIEMMNKQWMEKEIKQAFPHVNHRVVQSPPTSSTAATTPILVGGTANNANTDTTASTSWQAALARKYQLSPHPLMQNRSTTSPALQVAEPPQPHPQSLATSSTYLESTPGTNAIKKLAQGPVKYKAPIAH